MNNRNKKQTSYALVAGLLVGMAALVWDEPGYGREKHTTAGGAGLPIIVRLHDYTGIDQGILRSAESEAARIFESIGISASWVECPRNATDLKQMVSYLEPTAALTVDMNILPRSMARLAPVHETALGFTIFTEDNQQASVATVFYDRVAEEVDRSVASLPQILACAMSHELGHLLLRTREHSPKGIMSAVWSHEDQRKAGCGRLNFAPEQAERMRSEIRERSQPQAARGAAISVQVYNYAQVSNQTLKRGEEEAGRIFHLIGVETAWGNCNPATMDIHLATDCVPHKGPLNLTARIVPDFPVVQGVADRQTMGLSFGDLASVSYRWVTNEAGALNIAPSDILGPALAHELAHLLLRQPGHSEVGIMRSRWSREDFDTATHGTFSFTREQAEAIRIDIRERSQQQAARDAGIVVQVYNYAQVPNEVVTQAESGAEGIFRAAGVEIAWTNCKLPEDAQCSALLDPTHLGVRLLPEIGQAFDSSNRTMGLAVGHLATVSMRRVQEDAAEFGVQLEEVLGPAMAHEIGHLLLVSGGHSPAGIMRARWQREDYERAPRGAFNFTSEQAQSIQTEIRRRIQERAATAIATK